MSNESRMLHASNESRVLKIIIEHAQKSFGSAIEVKPAHELEADLDFDELDYIEVMIALEAEFNIHLDDEQFDELKTVQQVIEHVAGVCTVSEAQVAA